MRQNDNNHERVFLERVRRTLDDSVENLDAQTLSRLTQARHNALEQVKRKPYLHTHRFWLTTAGLVTTAAAVLLAIFLTRAPSVPQYYSAIEDVEILAANESPEFFSQLEFYAWLVEEMDDAG
jgi:negative regulator of sigma E activity